MSDVVRNNTVLNRFEQKPDGGVAFATYRASSGKLMILHTEVPTEMRGSGVGSRFVRLILEEIRRQGLKVVPRCSFVRAYMARHPQFNDLLL